MNKAGPDIVAGLLAALIVAGAASAGANAALGAHPWWALQTGLIGAVIGVVVFSGAGWFRVPIWVRGLLGLTTLALAGSAAYFGKATFVASFGDNPLAGRFWFLGWFGVSAGAVIVLATAFAWVRR